MVIKLHNTLSGEKEEFKPLNEGKVGIYNCGPTVYDIAHIGNLRTMVFYDIIRRIFEYNEYKVEQVMNITDVDDKTIRKSIEEKITLTELTEKYEKLFFEDIEKLNIIKPQKILSARAHMSEIIELISTLIKNGSAYEASDGIYFKISNCKNYGLLARLKLDKPTQERIENDEYDKENPRDFALWKFYKENDGDAVWTAPFGRGRPGWHIECSAMAIKSLGDTLDIHAGGSDLIFPHHTNEIAQSESATRKTFVNYWLHGGMMNVQSDKMAKSKGNFLKLKELIEEKISPLAYRYWLLTAHYRTQINFTFEAVSASQTALINFCNYFMAFGEKSGEIDIDYNNKFIDFINNDLDMPKAVALAWELIKDKNISNENKKATLLKFDEVFGLKLKDLKIPDNNEEIPEEIKFLIEERENARKAKDFKKSDALRSEIEARGYKVKDIPLS
ncbi:MAG: cysteine--tRNA ligase [Patescibacteria group bacterium]|nr:cysteine--tRNA ligase [Patescibacteria group bacterium]